jgi:hypothetical protein
MEERNKLFRLTTVKVPTVEQLINQFYQFLEENGAKEEFVAAFAKEEVNTTLYDYCVNKKIKPENMVSGTIIWYRTPSESYYWSDLDSKWHQLAQRLIK